MSNWENVDRKFRFTNKFEYADASFAELVFTYKGTPSSRKVMPVPFIISEIHGKILAAWVTENNLCIGGRKIFLGKFSWEMLQK